MVGIPAGRAILGTDPESIQALSRIYGVHPAWYQMEPPRREPHMSAFLLDAYPVTCARFMAFVEATSYAWPFTSHLARRLPASSDLPITMVSRRDAESYAAWAGKRLPTEDEWEYAARGPEGLAYPWGNTWDPTCCNHNAANMPGGPGLTPVDAFPRAASPFSVFDMVGNVSEWVIAPEGSCPVVKGGFWKQHDPSLFRAARRAPVRSIGQRLEYAGFRCAMDCTNLQR